jgi:integrase
MGFNSLKNTNQKLASNPELSDHNKQVLEDFFRKARSGGAGDATLRDYASRFNVLAKHIDFQLDNPSQKDLEELVAKFNRDEIKKQNGKNYSDSSKAKFWKTLSKFYRGFIKKQGKGYNQEIDGEELLEDLQIKVDLSTDVDPDRKPSPTEVKKVANHANTLRDRAIILFGWATGARIGEIFKTQYDDNILTWRDLEFNGDKMWVTLDGKTGEREIPVKTSMPVLKELWEKSNASLDDPVFFKQNHRSYCPECGAKAGLKSGDDRRNQAYRRYICKECDWQGKSDEVEKRKDPLTDSAVRRIIERCVERAGLQGEFDTNPHDFFRKARAIYKVRVGYTEHQMRGFFGWSETSDAPKHYIALVKEDLEKALAEEFGEEVEYENGYDEDALRPIQCKKCGTINSATQDICRNCNNGLTDQGQELTKEDSGDQNWRKSFIDVARERGMDAEDFDEMLDMSVAEFMEFMAEN